MNGVAYVSYNTYPGWHVKRLVRDMILFHTRSAIEPALRIQEARKLLGFIAKSLTDETKPYNRLLQHVVDGLHQSTDSYFFHEIMEEVNDPVYFHEFAERAAAKRLSYLGEANLDDVYPSDFLREAESVLHVPSFDMVRLGQYTDFLHNRAFRQTLLCHEHRKPSHTLRPERLVNLYIATQFRPTSPEPRLATTDVEEFKLSSGRWFQTASPVLKTALAYLGETWPRPVRFGELLHTVCARLNLPVEPGKTHHDREALTLGQCIVDSFSSGGGYFELWTCPPGFTLRIGERPVASPLARLQARTGDRLTNLRHEVVPVAPIGRRLVTHLDGSHDHQALCDVVTRMVMQGELKLEIDGQPVREPDQVRVYAETAVKRLLAEIASHALLVG